MKKYLQQILFFLLCIFSSCTGNYEQPTKLDPKDFNRRIAIGIETNAEWTKSPQSIAKEFFPRDAHQEGSNSYSIDEKRLSETERKVVVTEEGAFDDEVSGEKAIIDFKLKNQRWEIMKLYVSLKRRY